MLCYYHKVIKRCEFYEKIIITVTYNNNINAEVTPENINRTDDRYLMYFLFEQDTLMPLAVEPVIINPESSVE